MKTKNLLLIAAVGVVAYVLFMRSKKSSATPSAAPAPLATKPPTKDLRLGASEVM